MTVRGYQPAGYRHPNTRGLCTAGFAAVSFGAGVNGQLVSNIQNDFTGAAPALPDNYPFYGHPLPAVGGAIVGLEIMLHAGGAAGVAVNWHVNVNGVQFPAFNVTLGAAARRVGIWPAASVPFAALVDNYLSLTFDMAAPIAGNFRPSGVVFFEANATAPAP